MECKKNTENVNSKVLKTKNDKKVLLSKRAIRSGKNTRFIKEEEEKVLLSSSGLKTTLNKIPSLRDILF